jgi:hypothetical protein
MGSGHETAGLSDICRSLDVSAALLVLVFLVTALMLLPQGRVAEVAVALLVHLLGSRLERLGPRAAHSLMLHSLVVLPGDQRIDQFDEWVDHLRESGDDGLQSLVTAIGLVVRGLPRLAARARVRQVFDGMVRFEPNIGFVDGDGYKGQWLPDRRTRVIMIAMRYVGLINRWDRRLVATYTVVYDIVVEPHKEPVVSREIYVARHPPQRVLVWLAAKLGCLADDRRRTLDAVPSLLKSGLLLFATDLLGDDPVSGPESLFDSALKGSNGLLYADRSP